MISLTRSELLSRFRSWTQTKTAAPGHFSDARAYELLNEGQFEVFKTLIETFEEVYFVALQEGIAPVGGEINLDALDKPYYRAIDLQKWNGARWETVQIVGARQGRRRDSSWVEKWFPVGRKLKTDNNAIVGTYRLGYHYLIPNLTQDSQMTEIPLEYADLVPLEAARLGALQSRRTEDFQFFEAECGKRKAEMRKGAANRIASMQHSIIDVESREGGITLIDGFYIVS